MDQKHFSKKHVHTIIGTPPCFVERIKFLVDGPSNKLSTIWHKVVYFTFVAPKYILPLIDNSNRCSARRYLGIFLRNGRLRAALPFSSTLTKRRAMVILGMEMLNLSQISHWISADDIFESCALHILLFSWTFPAVQRSIRFHIFKYASERLKPIFFILQLTFADVFPLKNLKILDYYT